ncbi:MAG: hypothetical protein KME32_09350 [Mojavia pulchra JT2-VF2]|uniref:Uncharacterized protein n=1 Tax=Mojavia pulchra JT2-VF2 TaxID=287848 RepID=A0A951PYG1_9NOST|nr:hypothetical protein [Mojavia pulchra JT2-VF2]
MRLITEPYLSQVSRWSKTGRHILAQYDDQSIVVYIKRQETPSPRWVERDSRPVASRIGHRILVASSPCPIPHAPCPQNPTHAGVG